MKLKRVEVPLKVRATGEDGQVSGYGSVFGNEDSYGDIVAAGAFAESLSDHRAKGTAPAMLWQHNSGLPVGRWTEVKEDDRGLVLSGQVNMKTSRGADAFEHLKAGDISGMSIGFLTRESSFDEATGIRTLTKVDLWEVSFVTFPANELARVTETRSAAEIGKMTDTEIERVLRDAGFSRSEAKGYVHRLKALGAQRNAAALEVAETRAALAKLQDTLRPAAAR